MTYLYVAIQPSTCFTEEEIICMSHDETVMRDAVRDYSKRKYEYEMDEDGHPTWHNVDVLVDWSESITISRYHVYGFHTLKRDEEYK